MNKSMQLILNWICLFIMLTANILANALPINGLNTKQVSDLYPNYFVPAGFTFSIWFLIYVLLGGFTVFATKKILANKRGASARVVLEISPLFQISCLLNAGWIFAWHYLQVSLSVIIMLVLLITLIVIFSRLQLLRNQIGFRESIWVYQPFIVYLGWISVATIADITALLVHSGWNGFGIAASYWTYFMIVIAGILGLLFSYFRRDFLYTLVIAWAIFGIYSEQQKKTGINSNFALITLIVMLILTILVFIQSQKPKQFSSV